MYRYIIVYVTFLICINRILLINGDDSANETLIAEKKLAEQILNVLDHYKQDDPVGIPGANIPDPKPIPTMKHTFTVATMTFTNVNVYGLSKFRVVHIKSEISAMEVNVALTIDKLQVKGDYTMSTWLSRSQGPFVVNLTNVYVQGMANLAIERDGKLRAQDVKIDVNFGDISLKFENLGFMGSIFQGILNSVGNFLFESIKPAVLKDAYQKIREEVNKNLDKVIGDMRFPNSLSPLDMVIADTRNKVRQFDLDPFLVKDYNHVSQFYRADLTHTYIMGLSSFYRVGNISLSVENHTLIADFEVGTQRIFGTTHWDLNFVGGLMSRAGTASFSVEYMTVRLIFAQPLDTRKRPQCRDVQLELGNIQARCDGAGIVDYVIEFAVNILPNLLRYQIMDAIEGPILNKIQEKFNDTDVDDLIKNKLSTLKNVEMGDLPLNHLKRPSDTLEIPVEEDDFWNFD